MLEVKNLCFSYHHGRKFRLQDIHFSIEEGMVMCLLGKNGAGKSTLLNLIFGSLWKKEGEICINHQKLCKGNLAGLHQEMAYVGDEQWCFTGISVEENIAILSKLYEDFDLDHFRHIGRELAFPEWAMSRRVSDLSTGQAQKLAIAFAMARRPKLLLLDEPFAGLDAVSRVDLSGLLSEAARNRQMTIVISTNLTDDISGMTDYIGVLADGQMKLFGDRETVFEQYKTDDFQKLMEVSS